MPFQSSRTLFDQFKSRLRSKGRQWRGVLVSVGGSIEVPDRPYHYYVRLERSGGRGEPGIFPGALVRPLENLPVLIEEDPRDGRQVIIDIDWPTLANSGQTDIPDPRLSRHRTTHEFGGDDMLVWLSERQIYELRIQPGATDGHVNVLPGAYMLNGSLYINSSTIDVDLSTYQPSSGSVWVMLSIDDGYGVNVSSSQVDPEDLADASIGEFALGAVRLQSAYAAITWDDILPVKNRHSVPPDIVGLNSLGFDLTPTDVPTAVGTLSWNASEETLDIVLPNGVTGQMLQELFANVKNQTGASVSDGTPVMFAGAIGVSGRIKIMEAIADGSYLSAYFIGLVTETIDNGNDGKVTWYGKVRGVDATGSPYGETWSDGDPLYVSPITSGYLTNIRPTGASQVINIGIVEFAHTNGTIFVRPSWYGRLEDLSNVAITSIADGELIQWDSTTSSWVNADIADIVLPSIGAITKEPGGFLDQDNVGVSYDYTTRKITLTHTSGTITYYVDGVKYELTSPWVSDAHTATNGTWFLYDSGSGPTWSTTIWSFEYAQFAYANYNDPLGAYIGLRETHGFMPYLTHRELHEQVGTYRRSGGSLTTGTYTLQPVSPTDADNTPGFDAAVIADEDLATSIAIWAQGTYSLMYFSGAGTVVFNLTATLPFRVGTTYPIINEWDGSTFTDTETDNSRYFNVYQVILPAASDTESQKYRMLIVQPQADYTTLAGARAEDFREVYLGEFTDLSPEFVAYARITYRTSASYNSATGKSRIEAISYLTGPRASQVVSSTVTPASHTVLSDRSEPDQHPASAITNTPAGTISSTDVQAAITELDSSRYTDEDAVDAVAGALNNTTTISWYYDDPAGDIEGDVILKSGGSLDSDASGIYGKIASNSEINTGTDSEKIVTPSGLRYDIPATPAASRGVRLDSSGNMILPGLVQVSVEDAIDFARSGYDVMAVYQAAPSGSGGEGLQIRNETTATYLVNILENGKVGIGTGANLPETQLQVRGPSGSPGQIRVTNPEGNDVDVVVYRNGDTGTIFGMSPRGGIATLATNSDELVIGTNTAAKFYLGANSAVAATIDTSQNIGIGTQSPSAQVHIDQSDTYAEEPVLILDQADDSEEFIDFIASVGTGKPIDTAAVGSTYARLRIALNGTFYYLQAYNA